MPAQVIDGRSLQKQLAADAFTLWPADTPRPRMTLISIENPDPMLEINRQLHLRTFAAWGIPCDDVLIPSSAPQSDALAAVDAANEDETVAGIMVLMPLPDHFRIADILSRIDPDKELEGLHPDHLLATLASTDSPDHAVVPLVPDAITHTLAEYGLDMGVMNIVILTQTSLLDSNPVANVVIRAAAAGVLPTSAPLSVVPLEHPQAKVLAGNADLLIVSLEEPELVDASYVKPGAVVIDFNPSLVGFTERDDRPPLPILRGGVQTQSVSNVAAWIMPVPGGAGPVMLGILMRNLVTAALRRRKDTSWPQPLQSV